MDVDSPIVPSSLKIVSQPTNGTAVVDPATGVIIYTPIVVANSDTLTYAIEDEHGAISNEATVTIQRTTEGTPPVAVNDATATPEGTAISIPVTNNDTDADGTIDLNSVFVVSLPANGSVRRGDNGTFDYQPNLGFVGTDTFSYRVTDDDGLVSNAADVQITTAERDFPYQNPINNLDVDADGHVSPRDVLIIIKEIDDREVSSAETGAVSLTPAPGSLPAAYFDVDANGFIVARDVLLVILRINELSAASAEPPDAFQLDAAAAAAVFALDVDVFDPDEEEATA